MNSSFGSLLRLVFCALAACALAVSNASAVPVYGTSADLTGVRSIGSGLTGEGSYANSNFQIAWEITQNPDNTFDYSYTLSGFDNLMGGEVSHFTLDLSDDFDLLTVTDAELNGNPINANDIEFGNFDEPSNNPVYNIVGAVKFDVGGADPLTFSFTSTRAPVWHYAFVKGGQGNAWTNGLDDPLSMNTIDFIATPNSEIPEPATAALLGFGLLAAARRRRS